MKELIIKVNLHEHMKILNEKELKSFLNTVILKDIAVVGTIKEIVVE